MPFPFVFIISWALYKPPSSLLASSCWAFDLPVHTDTRPGSICIYFSLQCLLIYAPVKISTRPPLRKKAIWKKKCPSSGTWPGCMPQRSFFLLFLHSGLLHIQTLPSTHPPYYLPSRKKIYIKDMCMTALLSMSGVSCVFPFCLVYGNAHWLAGRVVCRGARCLEKSRRATDLLVWLCHMELGCTCAVFIFR